MNLETLIKYKHLRNNCAKMISELFNQPHPCAIIVNHFLYWGSIKSGVKDYNKFLWKYRCVDELLTFYDDLGKYKEMVSKKPISRFIHVQRVKLYET